MICPSKPNRSSAIEPFQVTLFFAGDARAMIKRIWGVSLVFSLACGGARSVDPALSTTQRAQPQERCLTKLDVDHPLVGRVWDVKNATFITRDALWAKLVTADYVLLGEKHDNPDHHRLQA